MTAVDQRSRPTPAGRTGGRPTPPGAPTAGRPAGLRGGLPARLDTPLASYYLVLGATVALIGFGLVMVLSSSSVEAFTDTGSPYAVFARQALFAALGLPLMVIAARLPVRAWLALGWLLLLVAIVAQSLVFTGLGYEVKGNRNWLALGPFTLQPSEAGKFALVVWTAAVLARKRPLLNSPMHALVPVVPAAGVLVALVLAGHDLGTTMVMMALVAVMLWIAGAPLRIFGVGLALAAVLVTLMVTSSDNRMRRITAWHSGDCAGADFLTSCYQSMHGKFALAAGGWWGVGLGASREKWGLLPEAHNDFIFAVIGEELGLAGTLVVLALFAALALGLVRIVLRSQDLFVKIATTGVLTWVVGQALINIGAVLGLFPVVGLPLPLVSSGGSALVMMMVALGMVIGFARREPEAAAALAARAGLVRRSLAVLPRGRGGRRR